MSWRYRKDTFQNIADIIASKDCSLTLLARAPNVKAAFKRQNKNLLEYLIAHLQEVIDIALGDKKADNDAVAALCMFFLTNQSPSFTAQFSNNPLFLMRLSKYITDDSLTERGLISFARILEFLVKVSNGFVLKMFPNRDKLIPMLLRHIKNFSIYSLLCEITDHGHKVTLEYLESINASKLIFEALGNDTFLNGRILTLLTNIISSGLPGSPLVTFLVDEKQLNKIFTFAMSDNQRVSSQSFKLLLEITGLCDEDLEDSDDEDSDAHRIFTYIVSKMPEICDFIGSPKPFCAAKSVANDLLVSVISTCEKIPEKVYKLLDSLFPRFFEQPTRSSLHCLYVKLLNAVVDRDDDYFVKYDLRPQIVSAFEKKDKILAAYWGHLHKITQRIIDSKCHFKKDCPGWNDYLNGRFQTMKKVMSAGYGGPVPKESLSGSSSDDLDFKPPSKFYLMSERKNIQFITQDELDDDFDDRLALRGRRK
ncbi:hypothetical protein TRFO_23831 [Tritrichomonas foetus]|uniref:Serine/threonine-protein phosphatase 4 regulatory subunit 3-like central domain-containing protein n=1 Tax=Tritrichomonas foetus TaxID=1144522 RepID=A0A1J4K8H6_9EUKA|nr:hypothetical protein TRFO_23831 [Tritrichomonas foetus]|eukprot:OHT07801.1 hypothetical protein TRFO_23831 [Tritrichomonas foetus]